METSQITKNLENILKSCLYAVLLLAALAFLFVFIINWEDWFLGIKLDGPAAGLSLLVKGAVAAALFYLLMKYPGRSLAISGISSLYFGFVFIDSAVTIQHRTEELFSPFLLVVLIIPVAYFIVLILNPRSAE